ncbi:monovalent cation:proton antiporter-2 (CPA2) family protein [Aureimonas altamirensis]|uniref:monovalent cation:proton antiporter-2 (CPA2) family protein n=1 Tax=Aureimonas altamirensis TaxID=370622 RepID=UPI001E2CD0F1|nr:monovalent cation:proton antiporter-2 (CPA2) family protein [Aureimonas altamirensis]UHD44291.1 monovalent cation:proton antiporter-2 (CPA2) family protein [Aureimonas altamirensis]
MAEAGLSGTVGPAVVLLASAVVAVPLFRRLGLGSVLGYFAGGLLVGPSILGIFTDPATILHISELGVVMFLFLIGVEMRPQKLWAMRTQIFGLGLAQVVLCIALLTVAAIMLGYSLPVAFVAGAGFVLSSTAVIMSVLQERGEIASESGQQSVSILLLEDLMIVPLLAVVAFLGATGVGEGEGLTLMSIVAPVAAVGFVVAAGRWLLDPFFALLARSRTTEVLTAGALLVVLGSALLMEFVGLSMAMGAFLAGVMLSGSSYRHQIETDVEPFKGLLMGLFFLAVGMSLDLTVVAAQWPMILALLALFVVVKSIGIYAVARAFGSSNLAALHRVSIFAQGGEFAFVLYSAAVGGGVITGPENAIFATVIILSMALTPLITIFADRLLQDDQVSLDGVEEPDGLKGRVLMIGFGRFGQIASQLLLAQAVDVSLIDNDPDRVREAGRFGFKVFYGDGTRLDILRQSGAGTADIIMLCVDKPAEADRMVELIRENFPNARILARSFDRGHSIRLRQAGVDFELRETLESAIVFGGAGLKMLGMTSMDVEEVTADIRQRDEDRLLAQAQGGIMVGNDTMLVEPRPEPLVQPRKRKPREAENEPAAA